MSDEPIRFRTACRHCGTTFTVGVSSLSPDLKLIEHREVCSFCGHLNKLPDGTIGELKAKEPPESGARDLQYHSAAMNFASTDVDVDTIALFPPIEALKANLLRSESMHALPVVLASFTGIYQQCIDQAFQSVTGAIKKDVIDPDEKAQINAKCAEFWKLNASQLGPEGWSAFVKSYGVDTVNRVSPFGGAYLWLALEAVLRSHVTGVWTAFEVLAGDLWECAVNAHPRGLSELKGGTGKKDASIPIILLQKPEYNFDLTGKMGTIIRDGDRAGIAFKTLEKIREAYERAFFEKADHIMDALRDRSISDLCVLRNVIVHRNAICDDKYRDGVGAGSMLPICEIGDPVPIDGVLSGNVVRAAVKAMFMLIKSVDKWIVTRS